MVEYLVVVGVIALAAIVGFRAFGDDTRKLSATQSACVDAMACGQGGAFPSSSVDAGAAGANDPNGNGNLLAKAGSAVWSFGKGVVVDGLWGTVKGLGSLAWNLATHPVDTTVGLVNGVGYAVTHPVTVAKSIGHEVADSWRKDPARTIGNGVFQLASLAVPVSKAGQVGKVAEVVEDAAGAAKTAEAAADAAKAADAAEAAATAAKVARAAPDAAAVERAWPKKWPEPPPGARITSTQQRMSVDAVTGSVQGEVRRDIVEKKVAEIQRVLDGGPGELPQVKMVPDPNHPGGHILIDQNHTYQAYKELGFREIPAQVYNDDGVQFLRNQHSYPDHTFPIGDMRVVDQFSGSPAEQAAARQAALSPTPGKP